MERITREVASERLFRVLGICLGFCFVCCTLGLILFVAGFGVTIVGLIGATAFIWMPLVLLYVWGRLLDQAMGFGQHERD